MMYITAGTFRIMLRQVCSFGLDEAEVMLALPPGSSLPDDPSGRVDETVIASFIGYIAGLRPGVRIGLEMGFRFPVAVMGIILNIYQNCRTLGEVFEKSQVYAPVVNTICRFSHHMKAGCFCHAMTLADGFAERYPLATRHIYESQYGIILGLMYALTGKHISPLAVCSPFSREGTRDLLEDLVTCPVTFGRPFAMYFPEWVMNLPVVNANAEMLVLAERLVGELMEKKPEGDVSAKIRRYLLAGLPGGNLGLKEMARNLNVSCRTLQRRLMNENTSYQKVLDDVRGELTRQYLAAGITLSETAFLVGFESQGAFCKFFRKHFGQQPTRYLKEVGEGR